jgi:hypothetical protein
MPVDAKPLLSSLVLAFCSLSELEAALASLVRLGANATTYIKGFASADTSVARGIISSKQRDSARGQV